jgi:hypothetical protein
MGLSHQPSCWLRPSSLSRNNKHFKERREARWQAGVRVFQHLGEDAEVLSIL